MVRRAFRWPDCLSLSTLSSLAKFDGLRGLSSRLCRESPRPPPSSALWFLERADRASGISHRRVQRHGRANERLQRLFINSVALMEIDGPSRVALEARVEEARRI